MFYITVELEFSLPKQFLIFGWLLTILNLLVKAIYCPGLWVVFQYALLILDTRRY